MDHVGFAEKLLRLTADDTRNILETPAHASAAACLTTLFGPTRRSDEIAQRLVVHGRNTGQQVRDLAKGTLICRFAKRLQQISSQSQLVGSGLRDKIQSANGKIMIYHNRDTLKGSVLGKTEGRDDMLTIGAVSLTRGWIVLTVW